MCDSTVSRVQFAIIVSCALQLNAMAQVSQLNDLFLRMAAERERFVQYTVNCEIIGPFGDLSSILPGWRPRKESRMEVYLESSRVDQHYVIALRDMSVNPPDWRLRGVSGNLGLSRTLTKELELRDIDTVQHRTFMQAQPGHTRSRLFDPMAIGLYFCGEFITGVSHETLISQWLGHSNYPTMHFKEEQGIVTFNENFDKEIKIDKTRSYWPISLRFEKGTVSWAVELGKFKEYDVPVHATLGCKSPNGATTTDIRLQWLSVNEPIKAGRDSAERLAAKFGFTIK